MDTQHIDTAISDLQASKDAWASLDIQAKLSMLRELRSKAGVHARRWVEAAVKAKGLSMGSRLAGEEWIAGPYGFIEAINALETTLERIASGADVLDGIKVRTRPEGQVVLEVLPLTTSDKLLFSGSSAQVWMQPGVTIESLRDRTAAFYSEEDPIGSVCLVLVGLFGPWRRKRYVDSTSRRALQALQRRRSCSSEDEPGERVPR